MVMLKMLMEIALPKMRGLLVMRMTMICPSGREVPSAESLRRRIKVHLPKFRLETVALHPESPLLTFSRSKWLIYQKMGTEGGPGWARPTRAHLGSLAPRWVVPTWWSPSGIYFLQYFFIYSKNILRWFLGHSENFYFCTKITPWQFCWKQCQSGDTSPTYL